MTASIFSIPREPLADGTPDDSCPECGGPTRNLIGGSRCDADEPCDWYEQW